MQTLQEKIKRADRLAAEVRLMRELQVQYFKYRDAKSLEACKIQEKKVDGLIADYYKGSTQSLLEG